MSDGAIPWKTKRRASVALSPVEVEYMVVWQAAKEADWLDGLLEGFGIDLRTPPIIFGDSSSACTNPRLPSAVEAHRHSVPLHSGACPNESARRQVHPYKSNDSGRTHQIASSSSAYRIQGDDGCLQEELARSWASTTRRSVRICYINAVTNNR